MPGDNTHRLSSSLHCRPGTLPARSRASGERHGPAVLDGLCSQTPAYQLVWGAGSPQAWGQWGDFSSGAQWSPEGHSTALPAAGQPAGLPVLMGWTPSWRCIHVSVPCWLLPMYQAPCQALDASEILTASL